jgi:tetratricopeptide (TPR) repeat protein
MRGAPAVLRLDWQSELLVRAWELEKRAQTDEVRELLEGLPRAELLKNSELGILLLNAYVFTFNQAAARVLERELLPTFEARGNDRLHRRYLNFRGVLLLRESKLSEAEPLFRQLDWMSTSAKDDLTLSFAWANLGHLNVLRLRYAEALGHYSRALVLARVQQGRRGMARIFGGTAFTYAEMEMYPESQRDYETARRYQENPHELAILDVDEARMLVQSGRLEAAARLASRAKALFAEHGIRPGFVAAATVLARIATSRGDFETARVELTLARSIDSNEPILRGEIEEEQAITEVLAGDERAAARAEELATRYYLSTNCPARAERMRARLAIRKGRA